MSRAFKRLGLPLKKTLGPAERDEEQQRAAFRRRASRVDPELYRVGGRVRHPHLHDAPLRARAPKGERAFGSVPRNRGKNTVLIASMTLEGAMGECMAVEGSTPRRSCSRPTWSASSHPLSLRPRQVVVVMDNLGAHKTDRVRELIEGRGCELWFLAPSYSSPDLNPIEEAFSKVKARLRKAAAVRMRREALTEAMGETLSAVTPQEARGWFAHCGYGPEGQPS